MHERLDRIVQEVNRKHGIMGTEELGSRALSTSVQNHFNGGKLMKMKLKVKAPEKETNLYETLDKKCCCWTCRSIK